MRYIVEEVTFYQVVDTGAAEEAPVKIHYEGADKDYAQQIADDMNQNAQAALDAQESIQQEAIKLRELEIAEHGLGGDSAS